MSRPLKLIQLNCFQFTYFDQILEFLKEQDADVINLQEATTGSISNFSNGIYLDRLAKELDMQVIYSPFTAKESQTGKLDWFGNAILTRLEILDHGIHWLHDGETKAGVMSYNDNQKLKEAIKINRNLAYPIVYTQPKNLVWALLSHEGKVFRNLTTHFTATQKCTETLQMIQEAQAICSFVENIKGVPTIFSGDLNIEQQAGCIALIQEKLNLINIGNNNTLSKDLHPIFLEPKYILSDPSLEHGRAVDYVFAKNLRILKWQITNVKISDHVPIVVEFEI
jgi:endonuclease/exonuclease/phosphatase family metal-dependent hydrolase